MVRTTNSHNMPRPQKSYIYQIKDFNIDLQKILESENWEKKHGSELSRIHKYEWKGKAYIYFSFKQPAKNMDKDEEEMIGAIKKEPYLLIKTLNSIKTFIMSGGEPMPEVKYVKMEWRNKLVLCDHEPYMGWVELTSTKGSKPGFRIIHLND